MRRFSFAFCCAALLVVALSIPACAQRPSPPAKAHCAFSNSKTIDMAYSSPRMKGRKIYGGLVPFGEVWRAGANEATTFVTNTALSVGGKPLPAGSYTIFVVPNPDKWTFIVSKKTGEWGIPYPGEQYDLFRTDMSVSKLSQPVEDFAIGFDKTGKGCVLHMDWETTRASIEISPSE
jgi:hypothetical protein